jgi:hypothetical protein
MLLAACGRLGFEPISAPADGPAPVIDMAADMALDGPAVCPAGTAAISAGARVCIELSEHGYDNWTNAGAMCAAANMRLCTAVEWETGCANVTGLVEMLGDNWGWVSDMIDANNAEKRGGSSACTDVSSHVITDPYEVRCCADI